jgi:hypothetical protein
MTRHRAKGGPPKTGLNDRLSVFEENRGPRLNSSVQL